MTDALEGNDSDKTFLFTGVTSDCVTPQFILGCHKLLSRKLNNAVPSIYTVFTS